MVKAKLWCRVTIVAPDGDELACCTLEGSGDPDIGAVDGVARLALLTSRLGGDMVVTDLSADLRALLDLTGLCAEVAGLSVEVEGQTELREKPIGIQEGQEEGRGADLAP